MASPLGRDCDGDGVHDLSVFSTDYVNPVGAGCCHVHEVPVRVGDDAIGLWSDAELGQDREWVGLQDGQCCRGVAGDVQPLAIRTECEDSGVSGQ